MPLTEVSRIMNSGSAENGRLLSILLANIRRGLERGDISEDACRARLWRVSSDFVGLKLPTYDVFCQLLITEFDWNTGEWYCRTPNLSSHLSERMVTTADYRGLAAWMGKPDSTAWRAPALAKRACAELTRIVTAPRSPGAMHPASQRSIGIPAIRGKPARPLWLTPFAGETRTVVEAARHSSSTALADRLCAVLGLSHIAPGSPVVAVITRETVRDLIAETSARLSGPTSLEAGGFRHYRHFPTDRSHAGDGYGRTYELDKATRDSFAPGSDYGAPEAVRRPMRVEQMSEFVFVGCASASPGYEREIDDAFCDLITEGSTITQMVSLLASDLGL